MARTELPNGVILPAEYSDDWYEDMTSNLTKLDDVIGSDSEKLNADGVYFLRMSSAALTDGGTGNFSDLNSSYKIKTGDLVLDSGRKLYRIVSVDSTNETFSVGNSLFKVTAESDLAPVAESGDYDDLDNKPSIPTKTSDLTNDSNFVDNTDPAVASGITSAKVTDYDTHLANTDIHVTAADKQKWNNGVSQSYVLRYSSTAITDNSTIAYSTLDNTDNIKADDKIIDVDGKIFSIVSVDSDNSTVTVGSALIDLALDANVMHLSGNESVNGIKNFKDIIPIDGDYLGNEASTNQRTIICLRANRDTADKSGAYITRFRQNRSQGALQTGDLQMIGFDVLENEVRTNNVLSIQCTDWLNNVPQRVNIISGAQSYSYGNSARKALFNDLNPGALSLPDLSNGIDISGFLDISQSSINTYTPPSDGYISILGRGSITNGIVIKTGSLFANMGQSVLDFDSTDRVSFCMCPVFKNQTVTIWLKSVSSLDSAKFFPCLGNV